MLTGNKQRPGHLRLASIAAVLAAALAVPATASAAPDELASASLKLELRSKGGLKLKPKSVTLSMRKGSLDPTTGEGTIKTRGSFRAKRGGNKLKVNLTKLNLAASGGKGSIEGEVGKKTVRKFATVKGGTLTRDGWGAKLENATVKLAKKGAKALRKRLGGGSVRTATASVARVKSGQKLGSLSVASVPKTVEVIPGSGTMVLEVNPLAGVASKFAAHCINALPGFNGVYAVPPATQGMSGLNVTFTFPVSGGSVAPDFSGGNVITGGGQNVAKNEGLIPPGCAGFPPVGTTIVQTELQTQFANKSLAANTTLPTGPVGVATLGNIDFSTATMSADPTTRKVSYSGATVTLDALSASIINQVFPNQSGIASMDFAGGDALGTLSLTVTTH